MQTTRTIPPVESEVHDYVSGESVMALLALAGTRSMDSEALRSRTKLSSDAFTRLLGWLQKEYLVEMVSSLEDMKVVERVGLTEKGESVLVSMLERTCELPELH